MSVLTVSLRERRSTGDVPHHPLDVYDPDRIILCDVIVQPLGEKRAL